VLHLVLEINGDLLAVDIDNLPDAPGPVKGVVPLVKNYKILKIMDSVLYRVFEVIKPGELDELIILGMLAVFLIIKSD
jgi:hypothetical protein